MTTIRATRVGDFARAMDQQTKALSGALRRAMTTTGQSVQGELRAQARGAGFSDGGRSIANTWRLNLYPRTARETLHPAALVYSKMPDVVEAFDRPRVLRVKTAGREWLAWPTGYNAARGRRGAGRRDGMRVTPQEMYRLGGFVIRSKRNPNISLWCLPLKVQAGKRGRIKLYAGYSEVLTGRVKGLQARRKAYAQERQFVPMFFLSKQVYQKKRLNIEFVRGRAPGILARAVASELAGLA